jgi:hypothetical protein
VDLSATVEGHLVATFGPEQGRASVTFLGVPTIHVLRFGPTDEGCWRYATLGMSATPMADPASYDAVSGPRAELVLTLRGRHDGVTRALATVAASPAVDGLVLAAGSTVDLQDELWPGARVSAVMLGEPGGLVPDLGDVQVFPVLPMTHDEAAFARGRGAAELRRLWLEQEIDLRDPSRPAARLDG